MSKRILTLAAGWLLISPVVQAIPTTYNVNLTVGAGSVTGTLETDGTLGVLTTANITDWNLTLDDATDSRSLIGPASGGDGSIASAFDLLTASATEVFLDFSLGLGGEFLINCRSISCTTHTWLFEAEGFSGGVNAGRMKIEHGIGILGGHVASVRSLSNQVSVGTTTSVPEPTTLSLLLAGLIGFGVTRRRKA